MDALLGNVSAPAKTVTYLRSRVIALILFSRVGLISEKDGRDSTAQSINFYAMFIGFAGMYWTNVTARPM